MLCSPWTQEEKDYLAEVTHGRSHKEIAALMNERFERYFSAGQIKGAINRYNLNTGRTGRFVKGQEPSNKGKTWADYMPPESQERCSATCFSKGDTPANRVPIGTERIDAKDGYTFVKVQDGYKNANWMQKHHLVWEQINGPVPEGHVIIFCDRDVKNCALENLMCISREIHGLLKLRKLKYHNRETAELAVTTARLMRATHKAACRKSNCFKCGQEFKARFSSQRTCDVCLERKAL